MAPLEPLKISGYIWRQLQWLKATKICREISGLPLSENFDGLSHCAHEMLWRARSRFVGGEENCGSPCTVQYSTKSVNRNLKKFANDLVLNNF